MTHSYKVHFFHLIWSTKQRKSQISSNVQPHLYSFMASTIKHNSGKLREIGGMPDHVHLLVELKTLDKFSQFVRNVKNSSSLWIHKNFPELHDFAWQDGFGSFSVSFSSLDDVKKYIQNQEKHHVSMSFDEEFLKFLTCHNVKYDERFALG